MITKSARLLSAFAALSLVTSPIAAPIARADVASSMDGFLDDMDVAANVANVPLGLCFTTKTDL